MFTVQKKLRKGTGPKLYCSTPVQLATHACHKELLSLKKNFPSAYFPSRLPILIYILVIHFKIDIKN